jgi:energy-coupling factor transporter ATP-binding protein EcfA2
MIKRIAIDNFKSLKHVDLHLGRLNLFIGTNASGKSNFFDALRVLQGIASGFGVKEVLNGAAKTSAGGEWLGIRGGLQHAVFVPHGKIVRDRDSSVRFLVHFERADGMALSYEVAFDGLARLTDEALVKDGKDVFRFDGRAAAFYPSEGASPAPCEVRGSSGSALLHAYRSGSAGEWKPLVEWWAAALSGTQFLFLDPATLRQYGSVVPVNRMGERGENFASIVKAICADAKTQAVYLTWLKELRPDEVDDVDTKPGAQDEPMFRVREHGQEFLAPVLSDGTLRFAAIAAVLFQPDQPPLLCIEEADNGIHASRVRLLVELLRRQAALGSVQVLATTHSPQVLAWLRPEEYPGTFLFRRDEATGESQIRSLTDIPRFSEIVSEHPVGDLFAEGWMECAP